MKAEKMTDIQDKGFDESRIEGKNAVMEALKAGRRIDKLYIARGEKDKIVSYIVSKAKSTGAVISEVDRRKLDYMSVTHAHQGVIALAAPREYSSLEDILNTSLAKSEPPLIVICDGISDPHNLGAVIRSAECAGAHGVIIPKHRSAGLSAIALKSSAGAAEHMHIARVANISAAITTLKDNGVWVYGASQDGGTRLWNCDFKGPCAIVIGSEGSGMSRLVSENCDYSVSIPMQGKVASLNASNAAAVLLFEVLRQRET